ncbi:MAG: hypothetical protein ACK5MQ_06875, partial [Pikeienuella sp.]
IDAARASTPEVFNALRDSVIVRVQGDPTRFGDLNQVEIDEIRRMRDLTAHWVLLLDASRAALDTAVAAAEGGSLEGMLTTGEALTAAAAAARRNLNAGE